MQARGVVGKFGEVGLQDGNVERTVDVAKDLESYNTFVETEKVQGTDESASQGQRNRNWMESRLSCGFCWVKERHRLSLGTWESVMELVGLVLE